MSCSVPTGRSYHNRSRSKRGRMATRSIYLVLVSLLQLVQLSFTRFVFQFELHAIDTNGDCSNFFDLELTSECETYLHRFCLREAGSSRANTDDSDCPLGANEPRVYADDTLPVTRVIFSEQSWPVSCYSVHVPNLLQIRL